MGEDEAITTTGIESETSSPSAQGALPPMLVRAVTEKVYQLWLQELRIERERRHPQFGSAWFERRIG